MSKVDLNILASTVSDVKIMFDPRDLIADSSLVDDIEFTNMMNVWRPMLEEVEDVIEELKSARDKIAKLEKVAKAASEVLASDGFHYLGELRDALKELGEK